MYSEETVKRALELLAKGVSAREISDRFGGSPSKSTISKWALGEVPSGKRMTARRSFPFDVKLGAVKRLAQGEPYRKIAEDIGCTPSAVLIWRKTYATKGEDGLKTARDIVSSINDQHRKRNEREQAAE